ncbi:MAG: hypothetical protein ACLP59_23780 [Bryobacteraceae bacterium]
MQYTSSPVDAGPAADRLATSHRHTRATFLAGLLLGAVAFALTVYHYLNSWISLPLL